MHNHTLLEVDVTTAKRWLDTQEAILIDVRELSEYNDAHIANAILIPLGEITADKLPKINLEQKIILHCARGIRSARAIEKVKNEQADLPLYNLIGGISEWMRLGLPVLKS